MSPFIFPSPSVQVVNLTFHKIFVEVRMSQVYLLLFLLVQLSKWSTKLCSKYLWYFELLCLKYISFDFSWAKWSTELFPNICGWIFEVSMSQVCPLLFFPVQVSKWSTKLFPKYLWVTLWSFNVSSMSPFIFSQSKYPTGQPNFSQDICGS